MRPRLRTAFALFLLATLALASGPAGADGPDRSRIFAKFENTGVDPDAAGALKAVFGRRRTRISTVFWGLEPGAAYELRADDMVLADGEAGDGGTLRFRFRATQNEPFEVDPREVVIELVQEDGRAVLEIGPLDGDDRDGRRNIKVRSRMKRTENLDRGRASLHYRRVPSGIEEFTVRTKAVPVGDYELFVDGVQQGVLTVKNDRRRSRLVYRGNGPGHGDAGTNDGNDHGNGNGNGRGRGKGNPHMKLDFRVLGVPIDLRLDGEVVFIGALRSKAGGIDGCRPREIEELLPPTDAAGDGEALLRLSLEENCQRRFHVEIEGVPEADYDLLVREALEGVIEARPSDGDAMEIEGDIEFRRPLGDGEDAELLDFDPRGAPIEIRMGDVVFFSGVFGE